VLEDGGRYSGGVLHSHSLGGRRQYQGVVLDSAKAIVDNAGTAFWSKLGALIALILFVLVQSQGSRARGWKHGHAVIGRYDGKNAVVRWEWAFLGKSSLETEHGSSHMTTRRVIDMVESNGAHFGRLVYHGRH